MTHDLAETIAHKWVDAAKAKDAETLTSMLASDIELLLPFQTVPITGAQDVMNSFIAFASVTRNFTYHRIWSNGASALLEFTATIEGEHLHAVDLITIGEQGKITRFDIMGRPVANFEKLGKAVDDFKKMGRQSRPSRKGVTEKGQAS